MSMHKKPLTMIERCGLVAHGLDTVSPSQLSDAFRYGVAWAINTNESEIQSIKAQLAEAKKDAAVGNWLCNYMASEQVEHDDYLVEACYENDPVKFKTAVIAATKEQS